MEKNKKNKVMIICVLVAVLIVFFLEKSEEAPNVEELDIAVGIGYNITEKSDGIYYDIPFNVYYFQENGKTKSNIRQGRDKTTGQVKQERQRESPRSYSLGFEKVVLIEEKFAKYGIRGILDVSFNLPKFNNDAFVFVCRENTNEYFKEDIMGYTSTSDFLYGLIKNMQDNWFFGENYKYKDLILIVDSEGRNAVLPYIEKEKDEIAIKGMALFKGDKLKAVIDINDAKWMNILREKKSKGLLTLKKNSKEYINSYSSSQKKVKCIKNGEECKFIIDLDISGDIISNTMYKDLFSNTETLKNFEKLMASEIRGYLLDFVKKMQTDYRVDCLELGKIAAAKYGRGTGVDWNEVVCRSEIEINVRFKVNSVGRGEY
ncbi:hypothetical protein Q428_02195 [Fervidicella metallireducens AeB]|uniref:Spore germination protein n=1 Tax=Fervidicella metallireducens AeB TaxID=1403537 RepID=A0A017RXM4_9CLOT|nr:Ger(x)C family spore germination C-terminal domain-containing protein [Fervidicella metallireducens]EYE89432.1 hypothetical protein Q428_02195 [Fervidicella metallireducens AeB]